MAVVAERLTGRYPQLSTTVVAEVVAAAYAQYATSSVRVYIPMLVEKDADEELAERVRLAGEPGSR
ncbi:three-helix bundle dimerization domain-containing protein [Aldersonia kunmingensis]|uniref:three-helix bundle dimerization domain-containing protein n=1 Tax=Aldersonia kunmingensis TaxID=408066 RepID=UPI000B2A7F2D|nr:hypothetical protein [Aldersonia kunmingensis]